MALSDFQKERYISSGNPRRMLFDEVRGSVNLYDQLMKKFASQYVFYSKLDATDAVELGIIDELGNADTATLALLAQFRTIMQELLAYDSNQTVTPSQDPRIAIDDLRNLNTI